MHLDRTATPRRSPPRRSQALVAVMLLALAVLATTSTITAATARSPALRMCPDAIGATWHITHFFIQYDSHGVPLGARLPASGDRYIVNAGARNCTLARQLIRRLTSAVPNKNTNGRNVGAGFVVPAGYGYLVQSPRGFFCAATRDDTHPGVRGDNRHLGYCASLNHTGSFSWTAGTPNPERNKPR